MINVHHKHLKGELCLQVLASDYNPYMAAALRSGQSVTLSVRPFSHLASACALSDLITSGKL